MRLFILVFASLSVVFAAVPAQAHSGWGLFAWLFGHEDHDYTSPYLEDGKRPHNTQWYYKDEWYADDWLTQYENELDLINGFYEADIFRDQKDDGGVPVLVVGPNFYHLSGYDKRRVTHVLDVVYGITDGDGVFLVRDWRTHRDVGVYTKHGLQLQ